MLYCVLNALTISSKRRTEQNEWYINQERRTIKNFPSRVLLLSENSLCTNTEDMQKESSETKMNKKEEMQTDKKKKLSYDLVKKMYPSSFRNWPILSLLKPEFIIQIHKVMIYDDGNRALIVTKNKNVYTLNYNKDDHLKTDDAHIGLYPKKMEELCGKGIKNFACNSYFVLALNEDEDVYSWRFNNKCILDNRSRLPYMTSKPTKVDSLYEVMDIACGSFHSLAVTYSGQVYAWGDNSYGQIGFKKPYVKTPCGYNHEANKVDLPSLIFKLKEEEVVRIACGSKFNMVVTKTGKLYGWGDNKSGQINHQYIINKLEQYYPYPIEITVNNKVIVKVACGFEHTLALTDEGKIYAWGKNDKGQVGVDNNMEFSALAMVDMPELVDNIAAYADLSVAVDSNKNIYVWGDCFGQNITTPFLTGFATINDAFAYSTMRVMYKSLIVSKSDVEQVLNILDSLGLPISVPGMTFDNSETCDFIIEVEKKHIHVHESILKTRSQYFKNMFARVSKDWIGNNKTESSSSADYVVPDKFAYIIYKAFLKYLYTGIIGLSLTNTLELMILADEYGETNLKKECNQIVKESINTFNVALFYSKAIEYKAKELEEFCFQFALCHMKDIILSQEYLKLDINIRNNFIQRAAKENAFRT